MPLDQQGHWSTDRTLKSPPRSVGWLVMCSCATEPADRRAGCAVVLLSGHRKPTTLRPVMNECATRMLRAALLMFTHAQQTDPSRSGRVWFLAYPYFLYLFPRRVRTSPVHRCPRQGARRSPLACLPRPSSCAPRTTRAPPPRTPLSTRSTSATTRTRP